MLSPVDFSVELASEETLASVTGLDRASNGPVHPRWKAARERRGGVGCNRMLAIRPLCCPNAHHLVGAPLKLYGTLLIDNIVT